MISVQLYTNIDTQCAYKYLIYPQLCFIQLVQMVQLVQIALYVQR